MRNFPLLRSAVFALVSTAAFAEEPKNPKPVASFTGHTTPVAAIAFKPDGKEIVSSCENDVRTWEAASCKEVALIKWSGGPVAAFSPDAKLIGVAAQFAKTQSDDFVVRDLATDKELVKFDPHGWKPGQSAFRPVVGAVAFSPDGERFATGGSIAKVGGSHGYPGGGVAIWETKTGKQLHHFPLTSFAGTVAFSRDGKTLVAGTYGAGGELPAPGEVWAWNTDTGKEIGKFRTRESVEAGDNSAWVSSVAISPDGTRVAASVSGIEASKPGALLPHEEQKADILVWDLKEGRLDQTLKGKDSYAGKIAYSPDGKLLATTVGNDRTLRLWDTTTGKVSHLLDHGIARVNCIAFSPDGKRIAIAGSDKDQTGVAKVFAVGGESK